MFQTTINKKIKNKTLTITKPKIILSLNKQFKNKLK
jgi:hypothetical protein